MKNHITERTGEFMTKPTGKVPPKKKTTPYRHQKPTHKPDTAWLQAAIDIAGMSQRTVGNMLGLDEAKFSKALSGHRKIGVQEIFELARILNQPPEKIASKFGYVFGAGKAKKPDSEK